MRLSPAPIEDLSPASNTGKRGTRDLPKGCDNAMSAKDMSTTRKYVESYGSGFVDNKMMPAPETSSKSSIPSHCTRDLSPFEASNYYPALSDLPRSVPYRDVFS